MGKIKFRLEEDEFVWSKNPVDGTYKVKLGYASLFFVDLQEQLIGGGLTI